MIMRNDQNEPNLTRSGGQMPRFFSVMLIALLLAPLARAQVPPETARKIYDAASPSLVAVQYTWEYEFGKVDFVGTGVVVSEDGLVMLSLAVISPGVSIPDAQLTDFKI